MTVFQRVGFCLLLLFVCYGCYSHRPTKAPMDVVHDLAPDTSGEPLLLVMLPGARDTPQDLIAQGFVQAIRARHLPVDVALPDLHMDYYLEQKVIGRLSADVIAPARAQGYRRIWLMGISLGGLGSLAYAREHPAEIEGVILLAPFLANRGLIAEVTAAGGLDRWQPGEIKTDDDERALVTWLKNYRADDGTRSRIYLGYGAEDRFAPASELLAARLPADQLAVRPGGHDWDTWKALWNELLDRRPFSHPMPQ
jgi:pimeloyl-ACP methyl ester carboxylesterase